MTQGLRLAPGRVFAGDFRVVRPLKAGGQGSLYVVEQLSTSKLRALKLMLPELVAQPTSRKRFELEAKIAARIQSDHVVESIASGVDAASGTPWLVMELLEGEDLAAYTQKKKRLPPAEVLEIFSQLCHALGEAHRQGIVHRDLKPENIFLSAPRRRGVPFMVKVLDFGIARILAESQTVSGSTTTGLGTPMWMAPEQTIPGGPVAPGTDVWPLGLLAFRLLTGYLFWKAPYDPGASVMMLMAEAFMHPMPTASERADHYKCKDRLPPGFDEWFARCVARPIEDRFADAGEAFGALEPLLVTFGEEAPGSAAAPRSGVPSGITAIAPSSSTPLPTTGPSVSTGQEIPGPRDSEGADPLKVPGPIGPVLAGPTAVGLGPQQTGPGRATWDGAPELAPDLVKSEAGSDPPAEPARRSAAPTMPDRAAAREAAPTDGEGAKEAEPPVDRRVRNVAISAALAGVVIGAVIFALRRPHAAHPAADPPRPSAQVTTVAPPPPRPPATAEPATDPAPTASASAEASASASATASGEPAVSGAHPRQKLCRSAGAKCFSNDDCCERTCRHWICKANAALEDPYGSSGN